MLGGAAAVAAASVIGTLPAWGQTAAHPPAGGSDPPASVTLAPEVTAMQHARQLSAEDVAGVLDGLTTPALAGR